MNFGQLTQHIKLKQIHDALQSYAAKAINIGPTLRNWLIGYFIVEHKQYGEDSNPKTTPYLRQHCPKKMLTNFQGEQSLIPKKIVSLPKTGIK